MKSDLPTAAYVFYVVQQNLPVIWFVIGMVVGWWLCRKTTRNKP